MEAYNKREHIIKQLHVMKYNGEYMEVYRGI